MMCGFAATQRIRLLSVIHSPSFAGGMEEVTTLTPNIDRHEITEVEMRTLFTSYPAVVGVISGLSRCSVWIDDPTSLDFDDGHLYEIDLRRNANAAITGKISWAEVEVDNHVNAGGRTTIGPLWPEGMTMGWVYISDAYMFSRGIGLDSGMALDALPHERQLVVYHPGGNDLRAGRRYCGFHARVVQRRGDEALVQLFPRGQSREPHMTQWIDLSSVTTCDAGADSLTTITSEDEGAFFVDWDLMMFWANQQARVSNGDQ
jgi:hypothetical protein